MSGTDPTPMDKDSSGRDPPPITSATCLAAHREPRARMTAIVRFEPSMLRARTQDSAMLSYGSPESVELQGGDHVQFSLPDLSHANVGTQGEIESPPSP